MGLLEAESPLLMSPPPLTVNSWDEVMWQVWDGFASQSSAQKSWQELACGRLLPSSAQASFHLPINPMGSKMSKKKDPHLKAASQKASPSPGL